MIFENYLNTEQICRNFLPGSYVHKYTYTYPPIVYVYMCIKMLFEIMHIKSLSQMSKNKYLYIRVNSFEGKC